MGAPIRLLALDADGTLLDERTQVGARTREALAEAARRGVEILIVTGRRYRSALPIVEQVGLPLDVGVHNGVLVRRTSDGATLFRRLMPPDDLRAAVTFLREEGLHPIVFVDRYDDGVDFVHDAEHPDDPYWADIFDRNRAWFRRVDDVLASGEDVLQVGVWERVERLRPAARRFADRFGVRMTHHLVTNVHYLGAVFEAYAPDAGKGEAVRRVRERLGIPREAVCAIGDDVNDLPMIREAGLGIAMGNAVPEVRRAADVVAGRNDEEGLAAAVERWVLGVR